jgi:signal transduction histidine kinase
MAVRGVAITLVSVTAVVVVRHMFDGGNDANVLFLIPVSVAGVVGIRYGALATALSAFAQLYFFIPPIHSFDFERPADGWSLLQSTIVALAIVLVIGGLRRAHARAEQAREKSFEELREAERRARHAQKMESLGRLTAGLAHEVNNLLSIILTYAELDARKLPADEPLREHFEEIAQAGRRGRELTARLLAFTRGESTTPEIIDVGAAIATTARMLQPLVGRHVRIVASVAPPVYRVKLARGQLEQIVTNLVINARDAMPNGGEVRIDATNLTLDEDTATRVGAKPGPHVKIAVADAGTGMDAATKARIFEPFYTTKDSDKGTGLGLPTVLAIVREGGGAVAVESEPSRGTTFEIFLPRAKDS